MKYTISNLTSKDIELLYRLFGSMYSKEFENIRNQIIKAEKAKSMYEASIAKRKNT